MRIQIHRFKSGSKKERDASARHAEKIISQGGVIVFPTDTCYGLAANAGREETIRRVYELKGREYGKPFNLMVKDKAAFERYGRYSPLIDEILTKYSGFLFAFVVKRTDALPAFFNPGFESVGIVMPKHPFCQRLFRYCVLPLIGTSANVSGGVECYTLEEVLRQFPCHKDYAFPIAIFDGGSLPFRRPSTVIKIIDDNNFIELRRGEAGEIIL